MDPRQTYLLGVATAFATIAVVWFLLRLSGPWLMARAAGAPVSLIQIFGMRMRGSDPKIVLAAYVALVRLGEAVGVNEVEAAYLGLPAGQRDLSGVLRAVRPELLARLERESRLRQAGGAA